MPPHSPCPPLTFGHTGLLGNSKLGVGTSFFLSPYLWPCDGLQNRLEPGSFLHWSGTHPWPMKENIGRTTAAPTSGDLKGELQICVCHQIPYILYCVLGKYWTPCILSLLFNNAENHRLRSWGRSSARALSRLSGRLRNCLCWIFCQELSLMLTGETCPWLCCCLDRCFCKENSSLQPVSTSLWTTAAAVFFKDGREVYCG